MSEREQYREALGALAREIGLDVKAFGLRQELMIDEIAVAFSLIKRARGHVIQIACKVGPLPPQPPLPLLRLLLQANTLGAATGGTTLGLQCSAEDIVLVSAHPLDTPQVALARACRTLAEVAGIWAAALQRGALIPAGARAAS